MRRHHLIPQLNNKGFTLVEVIVSVLIMSMVSSMIVVFVQSSLKTYQMAEEDATLQTEASTSSLFINELLLEARAVGTVSGSFSVTDSDGTNHVGKAVYIIDPDRNVGFIVLDTTDHKLYYKEVAGTGLIFTANNSGIPDCAAMLSDVFDNRYALLADCAESISISHDGALATLVMKFKYSFTGTSDEYVTTIKCECRNYNAKVTLTNLSGASSE